jgi:hypothetical protein
MNLSRQAAFSMHRFLQCGVLFLLRCFEADHKATLQTIFHPQLPLIFS